VLYFAEGSTSTISVAEWRGHRTILVNGRTEASDYLPDLQVEYLLGHVPMLLHRDPRRALVIGLGAGVTLGAVTAHEEAESITLVEIEPVVFDGTRKFSDLNDAALDDPRLEIVIQDGRNFLKTTPRRFDVITSDPIYPWNAGSGYLYTTEYYRLAAERLDEGGVMCQWWPASDLSNDDFRALVRTFATAFPYTSLWQTTYDVILIGSNRPIQVDLGDLARRMAQPRVTRQLARVGLDSLLPFLAEFALDDAALRSYAEGAPLNTDDNLYLEFWSPLAIGSRGAPFNVLSIDQHRVNPAAILAGPEPFFSSPEEAVATLAKHQEAKQATTHIYFGARAELFARESLRDSSRRLRRILLELPDYAPARAQLANSLVQIAVRMLDQKRFVVPSAMSKAAVTTMTRSLAVEWGRYGIRLNAIAPGVFPTEGAAKRLRPGEEPGARTTAVNPMGRVGQMSELQNLATFLLAPGCEWLNGEMITVDGAQHLVSAGGFYDLREWDDEQWGAARDAIRATNEKDRAARGP
jgi:spermidine synthase